MGNCIGGTRGHHKTKYSISERFWSKVDVLDVDSCWIWKGYTRFGYGQFNIGGITFPAHRVSYELMVDSIPVNAHLDHLCRNHSCVNPNHLEPVTAQENLLRGLGASAKNAKKVNCPKGHPLTGSNLYIDPYNNSRCCRTCRLERRIRDGNKYRIGKEEQNKQYQKQRYESRKQEYSIKQKQYYQKNKERIKKRMNDYYYNKVRVNKE